MIKGEPPSRTNCGLVNARWERLLLGSLARYGRPGRSGWLPEGLKVTGDRHGPLSPLVMVALRLTCPSLARTRAVRSRRRRRMQQCVEADCPARTPATRFRNSASRWTSEPAWRRAMRGRRVAGDLRKGTRTVLRVIGWLLSARLCRPWINDVHAERRKIPGFARGDGGASSNHTGCDLRCGVRTKLASLLRNGCIYVDDAPGKCTLDGSDPSKQICASRRRAGLRPRDFLGRRRL